MPVGWRWPWPAAWSTPGAVHGQGQKDSEEEAPRHQELRLSLHHRDLAVLGWADDRLPPQHTARQADRSGQGRRRVARCTATLDAARCETCHGVRSCRGARRLCRTRRSRAPRVCCSAAVSSAKIGSASVSCAARSLSRQASRPVAQRGEAGLQVQRHGIVDFGADLALGQVRSQCVAAPVGHADDVLVPHMAPARHRVGSPSTRSSRAAAKQFVIALGVRLPRGGPVVEVRQLDVQHRGLQRVEPAVDAHDRGDSSAAACRGRAAGAAGRPAARRAWSSARRRRSRPGSWWDRS